MPLWFTIYEPSQWKGIALLVSVRMLDVVGLAVFFGWAYMKTKNIWCCVLLHGVNNEAHQHLIRCLATMRLKV